MSFYCEKHVGSGRKVKWCCKCGCTIDIGQSSYSIPGENFEVNHDMCIPCHDECEKDGIDEICDVMCDEEDEDIFDGIDEVSIMIRDEEGFGLGEIRPCFDDDFDFNVDMYQNRINVNALDDEKIIEELGEGKMFWDKTKTMFEAINKILNFWHIEDIDEVEDIKTFSSIKECVEYFKTSDEKFIVYVIGE